MTLREIARRYAGNRDWERAARELEQRYGVPILAGGAPELAAASTNPGFPGHPLMPPVVSGTTITIDTMLNQPTRVTRMIADMSLQRFVANYLFSSAGGVTGGAVVYDQAVENELYADRDAQQVSPGGEFPLVTALRPQPLVAPVEKWGGKTYITDEARERNNPIWFTNEIRKLTNVIVRRLNVRAMEVANTAGNSQTMASPSVWGTAVPPWGGASPTPPGQTPAATFAALQSKEVTDELGVSYNLAILNPADNMALELFYANMGGATQVLAGYGFDAAIPGQPGGRFITPRQAAHSMLAAAQGQVGEMRVEKPLGTETWREAETERTWVQASVRPVMYVTDPFSLVTVTGI